MINLKFITSLLSVRSLKELLTERILKAFKTTFTETNDLYDWDSKPNPKVLNYLKQRSAILSEKTMSRLHGNLELTLLEGINNRESITDLKARINPIFVNMKDYEIERLARTESLNAMEEGTFQAHVESGVAKWKIWKATPGKRTAADSKRLDGQIQPIDKPFRDPKTGDECMHSPNRPNCRCTILYVAELPKYKKKDGLMYKD